MNAAKSKKYTAYISVSHKLLHTIHRDESGCSIEVVFKRCGIHEALIKQNSIVFILEVSTYFLRESLRRLCNPTCPTSFTAKMSVM